MGGLWGFSLADQAIPTNATDTLANVKSILELPAGANQGLKLAYLDVTFDGTTTSNKPVLLQLIGATATGTFPSSSVTPIAWDGIAVNDSSVVTAANVKYGTATAEGTVVSGNGWAVYRLNPTAGLVQQIPLSDELWIAKATFFRLRAVAVNAVNGSFNLRWRE